MNEDLLRAELRALRRRIDQAEARNLRLARLFVTYMGQAGLDRPERVKNAQAFAEMGITIVGGEDADPGEFDECAAVGRPDGPGFFASGVLAADPRLVITAAHCGPPTSPLPTRVVLGTQTVNGLSPGQLLPAVFKPYPGAVPFGPHDIAIMVLANASTTDPVDLATTAELQAATQVTLVGFGTNIASGDRSGLGIKRFVTVSIQFVRGGASDRPGNPMAAYDFDKDLEFLVGEPGAGICIGDSGGPAYIEVNGQRKLAGITSRIPNVSGPVCNGLSILTRVDVHRAWILGKIPTP